MKSRIIFSILLMASLFACNDDHNQNDLREGVIFRFFARECNYVWADNFKHTEITAYGITSLSFDPVPKDEVIKLSDYTLFFNTCNVGLDEFPETYKKVFLSENYNPTYMAPYQFFSKLSDPRTDASDSEIENKLSSYLEAVYGKKGVRAARSEAPQAILQGIDYRTTPLEAIDITCSKDLFGVKAGNSLNQYFKIIGYPSYHSFIISKHKGLLTENIRDISISKYLSFSPMAPAALYLSFREDAKISEKVTLQFFVELQLEGGKKISAASKELTLKP